MRSHNPRLLLHALQQRDLRRNGMSRVPALQPVQALRKDRREPKLQVRSRPLHSMRLVSAGESGSLFVAASAGEYFYYYASFETYVRSALMDVNCVRKVEISVKLVSQLGVVVQRP